LEDVDTIVILLFFIEIICILLFEIRIKFQVTRDGQKSSACVVETHRPFGELLPDFLVLSEGQVA
jgi:hypothetical protein